MIRSDPSSFAVSGFLLAGLLHFIAMYPLCKITTKPMNQRKILINMPTVEILASIFQIILTYDNPTNDTSTNARLSLKIIFFGFLQCMLS